MSVGWRESDWSQLRDVMAIEEPRVCATLAGYGLLKFFECLLIWVHEYLLQFLIRMWSPDLHCFMVRGGEDRLHCGGGCILFDWAPFSGNSPTGGVSVTCGCVIGDIGPEVLFEENYMLGPIVSIRVMDALAHRCVAAMIVRVYGSLTTQQISGGQMSVMGRALASEHFAWGLTLHARMVGQLVRCWSTDTEDFAFGSILVAWFLERVPMLHPRILLGTPDA
jgi:hypothetical protein